MQRLLVFLAGMALLAATVPAKAQAVVVTNYPGMYQALLDAETKGENVDIIMDGDVIIPAAEPLSVYHFGGRAGLPNIRTIVTITAREGSVIKRGLESCTRANADELDPRLNFRIFNVLGEDAHLVLDGVTVSHGCIAPEEGIAYAGGIFVGFASSLTMRDSKLEHNRAYAGLADGLRGPAAHGGGIYLSKRAQANITDTELRSNVAWGGLPNEEGGGGQALGGGIFVGGQDASDFDARLSISRGVFVGNSAGGGDSNTPEAPGGLAAGGAIYNEGRILSISSTTFTTNGAVGGGAPAEGGTGGSAFGGAIANGMNTEMGTGVNRSAGNTEFLVQSAFANNYAVSGGGNLSGQAGGGAIANLRGTLDAEHVDFTNSTALATGSTYATDVARGGALFSVAVADIAHASFHGNRAMTINTQLPGEALGGAVYIGSRRTSLQNSTVSGNQVIGGNAINEGWRGANAFGGGLFFDADAQIEHLTIHDNEALGGTGPYDDGIGQGGGVYIQTGSDTTFVRNTIISGNRADYAPDCNRLPSEGYNLLGDDADCDIYGDTNGLIVNDDPLLGPLADNGCVSPLPAPLTCTLTHRISTDSPAHNSGLVTLELDQRELERPYGDSSDIGAYEWSFFGPSAFFIVDAETNAVVGNLSDGSTMNLSSLPPTFYIELAVDAEVVVFDYQGVEGFSVAETAPFSLTGDNPVELAGGEHTLTATAYVEDVVVASETVRFAVTD